MQLNTTPAEYDLIIDALKDQLINTQEYQHSACNQYSEEWYEAQMDCDKIEALLRKLENKQ